jgi:phosphatidylglycerol lysyltransferase
VNAPAEALARWADHPSAYLALNEGTEHFRLAGCPGVIAYRSTRSYLFQLGGPFAPEGERRRLLDGFRVFAREKRRKICALQVRPGDLGVYAEAGFRLNQLGTSYTLDVDRFSLSLPGHRKLRNKVRRAEREGITVEELGRDVPWTPAVRDELEAVTRSWLAAKGAGKRLLSFLVGDLAFHDPRRRVFVARKNRAMVAFVTYVPAYGTRPGLMHDLSRRLPDAPPGALERINVCALERFREEGIGWLSFGLTPFSGIDDGAHGHPSRSRVVSFLVSLLSRHGEVIYPAARQVAYKLKWLPDVIEPEYLAFEGRFRLSCAIELLGLTRAL